ncbi:MAG: 2-oxoglutarate dehydrogenase E1 component [Candidatus Lightella neohaematopini]|nr:2-oxoglutarate dehydrogenase E1 component [Candidatus Lightella neohaematopini]MCV2528714.1 2-oxoglutarate dehydrogenase E1 component [Candidatus Lightella neohaematopini]
MKSCKHLTYIKIINLINNFRNYGYRLANLDPLNLYNKPLIPELNINYYKFTNTELQSIIFIQNKKIKIIELYKLMKKIYCNSIGIEYMYINNKAQKLWIQKYLEKNNNLILDNKKKIRLLEDLIIAEKFEHYLNYMFPKVKRFSLEGSDVLIPMLKEVIYYAISNNFNEIILGMSHRGRLNVLVNIFGKSINSIINEFNDLISINDVKYHQGFFSKLKFNSKIIKLSLLFNPSHLEIIYPVVMGLVKSRTDKINNYNIIPIIIHGDLAISGQGIVQETINMSKVNGYNNNGTLHIIINNQIGFTTSNKFNISDNNCSSILKIIQSPIIHVNADDPEASIFVVKFALTFCFTFKQDVIINLVCYRRNGHSEIDEPSITQPTIYKIIKNHPSVIKLYFNKLKKSNILNSQYSKILKLNYLKILENNRFYKNYTINNEFFSKSKQNSIYNIKKDINYLIQLNKIINKIPNDIILQPLVKKIYENRNHQISEKKLFDWGNAEILAYATIIDLGIFVRLSGEDIIRGTFSQRHISVYDQNNGKIYTPLSSINNDKFQVWNSILSEEAVLAFEYGYSIFNKPYTLVVWEAQFGDFANGAQVVIDQFISSGEQKWGIMCGLVIFLPHGYEGNGPEHSSARIERYLQLCASSNMQVCIPTTTSQMYHLLCTQAINNIYKPLILIYPKSLLRNKLSYSPLIELSLNTFKKVIDEIDNINRNKIKKIIICVGKIYYELLNLRRKKNNNYIAIIRIEQLYPFPTKILSNIIKKYKYVNSFIWCQEEPKNQGAWLYCKNFLVKILGYNNIKYVGRSYSATTAEGSIKEHKIIQDNLLNEAIN